MAVAITGLGAIAPHGDETGSLFAALMQGRSAIAPVFADLLPKPAVAATVAFDQNRWFTKLQLPGVDRVSQLAVAAADLALKDAGGLADVDRERVGVYVGCGMGGASSLETAYRGARVPPLTIPAFMPNAPAGHVAMRNGVLGPVLTYSVACASSAVAIAEAAAAVERGDLDVAIAGGSEALIVPGVVVAWQAMQTLGAVEPGRESRVGQAVREGPQRLRARRGLRLRHHRERGAGSCARRPRLCAARRLGHVVRRDASDEARRARAGACAARGAEARRPASARRRLLQRARHRDAHRRCRRAQRAGRRVG